ncbi:unnamed protein product [Rotaria sp. Silwood1]|nr:unnamed protein product [Rotaria sp. Silwood1]
MSTPPLFKTLRQLHICISYNHSPKPTANLSIPMFNLHTFTLVQTFFSMYTIEWTLFETLTSSKIMPILRRANVSLFIDINDLNRISSSALFTDHRHVNVNFAFNLFNCPKYIEMTQYIPRGNRFHPREISRGHQYNHHMWYSLPWTFDEFFHEYIPKQWITKIEVFEKPIKLMRVDQSSLRTLDAAGQILASPIFSLPHVALSDCIETLHLSYYNKPINIQLSSLRNITLVNSINCLNYCSAFPPTIHSMRILLFYYLPNYMLPN